jgi:Mannosyl-glycoprotein endo-beta-N-acetylglucosaminidase
VTEAAFVAAMEDHAHDAGVASGVLPSVILAQWGIETAWGSSLAWTLQHNPAGIGWNGHAYTTYPTIAAGIAGWVSTIFQPDYDAVRAAKGRQAQAIALGRSPWAGSHYIAPPGGPGSALLDVIALYGFARFDPTAPAPPEEDPLPYTGPFVGHDANRQFIVWPNGTKTALGATTDGSTLTANPGELEWPYIPLSTAALDAIPG